MAGQTATTNQLADQARSRLEAGEERAAAEKASRERAAAAQAATRRDYEQRVVAAAGAQSAMRSAEQQVRGPRLQLGAPACACWLELVPLTEVSDHAGRDAGRRSDLEHH